MQSTWDANLVIHLETLCAVRFRNTLFSIKRENLNLSATNNPGLASRGAPRADGLTGWPEI